MMHDAERHTRKAKTWALKELWAKVANECLAQTGDEGRAGVVLTGAGRASLSRVSFSLAEIHCAVHWAVVAGRTGSGH